MKNILAILALGTILFIASCSEDGTPTPDTDPRDKFTGSWSCKETIVGSPSTIFPIEISKQGSADTILISNFSNYGDSAIARAYVLDNALTIPGQDIGVTSIHVQGSGVYSNDKLSLEYKTDGDDATAVCTR